MSNANSIDIRVVAKDLASKTIEEVKKQTQGLGDSAEVASKQSSVLSGVIAGLTASVVSFGLSIVSSGINKLGDFLGDSVSAATEFEKSMTTLSIIAPRFGVNIEDAKKAAQDLGRELRIGVGPAAESLQNLLKGGLNLDQAQELMRRFTNEAITGKSSSISLADAVQNLSFAYTTNNSALGNLSGISENFSDITEKGRKALLAEGKTLSEITDDMAKYRGLMDLTNLTLGSSEKFTGTLIDTQAQLGLKFDELKLKVGNALAPVLNDLLKTFLDLSEEVGTVFGPIMDNLGPIFNTVIESGGILLDMIAHFIDDGETLSDRWGDLLKLFGLTDEQIKAVMKQLRPFLITLSDLRDQLIRLGQNILNFVNTVRVPFEKFVNNMVNILGEILPPIIERIGPFIQKLGNVFSTVFPVVADILTKVFEIATPLFEWLAKILGAILPPIIEWFGNLIESIGQTFKDIWTIIEPVVNLIIDIIKTAFYLLEWIWENVTRPVLQAFADFWMKNIAPELEKLKPFFQSVADFVQSNFINPVMSGIKQVQSALALLRNDREEYLKIQGQVASLNEQRTASLALSNGKDQQARAFLKNDPLSMSIYGDAGINAMTGDRLYAAAASRGFKFAKGADFITNGAMPMIVGDNPGGRERVTVTPLSSPNTNGPQNKPTVVNNFYGYDTSQISSIIINRLNLGY